MRFLSIYKCPGRNTPPTQEEMARMGKLIEEWMRAGKLLSTEGCLPSSLGARVRVDSGKYNVSDGPFTEAKELVGGFAILDAPSKEAAVEYAKELLKVVGEGECELRQLYDASTLPGAQTKQQQPSRSAANPMKSKSQNGDCYAIHGNYQGDRSIRGRWPSRFGNYDGNGQL
jgi:hypothetical protein